MIIKFWHAILFSVIVSNKAVNPGCDKTVFSSADEFALTLYAYYACALLLFIHEPECALCIVNHALSVLNSICILLMHVNMHVQVFICICFVCDLCIYKMECV